MKTPLVLVLTLCASVSDAQIAPITGLPGGPNMCPQCAPVPAYTPPASSSPSGGGMGFLVGQKPLNNTGGFLCVYNVNGQQLVFSHQGQCPATVGG